MKIKIKNQIKKRNDAMSEELSLSNNVQEENETSIPERISNRRHELRTTASRGIVVSLFGSYDPKPMERPRVSSDFKEFTASQQIVEAIRFAGARTLYCISPEGGLQAWWKLLLRGFLVTVPALMVLYAVTVVFAMILLQLQMAAESLAVISLCVLVSAICFAVLYSIMSVLLFKKFSKS